MSQFSVLCLCYHTPHIANKTHELIYKRQLLFWLLFQDWEKDEGRNIEAKVKICVVLVHIFSDRCTVSITK